MYGHSQLAWNFPSVGLVVFSKTLLKTNFPALNVRDFTRWLCKFASLCWYNAMRIAATSQSSFVVSRSLVKASEFSFSGIYVRMVGIPIFVGMIASIPYVRVKGDSPVGFWLVVL